MAWNNPLYRNSARRISAEPAASEVSPGEDSLRKRVHMGRRRGVLGSFDSLRVSDGCQIPTWIF